MRDEELTHFALHLKRNITAMQWSKLDKHLRVTRNSMTRLLTGNRDWMLDEIAVVAAMLKEEPIDLIQQHGIGTQIITIAEYNQIAQPHGLEVGLVAHVA